MRDIQYAVAFSVLSLITPENWTLAFSRDDDGKLSPGPISRARSLPAARIASGLCRNSLPKNRGRRESQVLVAPAASHANKKAHERSRHRFTETVRPSLRNGFNGLYRALLGDEFVLSPSLAN